MSRYVSPKKRQRVEKRADSRCEYCLIHKDDTFFSCEIDHIISVKHGGGNEESNLAYSCFICNRNKGSDLGSMLLPNQLLIRFYNPRIHTWSDHFSLDGVVIQAKTDIGRVTVKVLELNADERLLERAGLQSIGHYPTSIS